jgi:NitT/TauT family transport system ATP-binding protein/taurine transport system ATP-binding protein
VIAVGERSHSRLKLRRQGASPPAEAGRARPERIELRGVTHRFGSTKRSTPALVGVDLSIEPGEFVCLVGPSGCGKTTLLKLIAGFFEPTLGEVLVNGEPVENPGADRGMVFQQPTLFPWLTVRGNAEIGPRMSGVPRQQLKALSDRYLELVGLGDVADQHPYELSGGMQQRCAIARALANDPAIVLMDEPFGALDALTRERLQQELKEIWRQTGKSIVFVTHSVEEAVYLGSRVVVMSPRPGRIVFNEPVLLPALNGDGRDVRLLPEFTALRARIGSMIGAA